ncbi:MAG: YeaH/YhbH family protein [Candidatus Hodarchaeales archaeon]|jgi:sporulation protein YhbH
MAIFKEHKHNSDRSATDRQRHKQKIDKAIREGIHDIVADESIIGKNGKKKFKIPVKGIKEYRFVYGENENQKAGSAPGKDLKKGDIIKSGNQKQKGKGDKAGNEKGEEFYEVEITLDELSSYLFDDLNLPDLEKKSLKQVTKESYKRKGIRPHGIRPRLDKKKTVVQKLKRKAAASRRENFDPEEDFSFHHDDLRYKHITQTKKEISNAVIFFMMDVSGSMSKTKKYLARSFFFLLYHFIRVKYENTDIVFISHDIEANEVSEEQFFGRGSSGGTYVSSALELTLEIINKRYHPSLYNIYAFHASDGDNWDNDVEKSIDLSIRLKEICQLYAFCEIEPSDQKFNFMPKKMGSHYEPISDHKFKLIEIESKEDVWPAFKKLFGVNNG